MIFEDILKIFTFAICAVCTLLLSIGCSSTSEICQETDWYEHGRQTGARGEQAQYDSLRVQCKNTQPSEVTDAYRNGYNAGQAEYCTLDNAFFLGRSGKTYHFICPESIETAFLKRYTHGKKAYELEQANRMIDRQINDIFARLREHELDQVKKKLLNSQLSELKKERAQNEKQLMKIKTQASVSTL